jgi:NADPH-dependent glutamate synthase beta subunit-like oxidoreductase
MISPCEVECPIGMDIPSYVVAISQGRFREALEVILETNPLPAVCGRVCHHPCEQACNRGILDAPVAIRALKRFVADHCGFSLREQVFSYEITRGEKVAVIGSGPAGLTAAHDLAKLGFPTVIFEASSSPGGMLTRCLPEFILPRRAVESDIDYIVRRGVKIKTSMALGRDFDLDDLRRRGFKAILLAVGAQTSLELPIEGRNLRGVEGALDFLSRVKTDKRKGVKGDLLVIGGGNVALDAARAGLRQGYSTVHLACLERRSEMPAFEWEIEAAEAEGVVFHYGLAPQGFIGENWVCGVNFRRVKSLTKDSKGRLSWTLAEGPGAEQVLMASLVVTAIGQRPDLNFLKGLSVSISDDQDFLTPNDQGHLEKNIFYAGDISNPRGTVAEAIRAGRRTAEAIAGFLIGEGFGQTAQSHSTKEPFLMSKKDKKKLRDLIPVRERWEVPKLPVKTRRRCQEEVEMGYTVFEAVQEAKRCLNCRTCLNCVLERNQVCFEQGTRLLT